MKAIILAGGFGTRLQSVVKDVPKPMADVNGRVFLEYILDKLLPFIDGIILSVGYKQEVITKHFQNTYKGISIQYSCEETPLGTGGAIKQALGLIENEESVLILNGDTFFDLDIQKFISSSKSNKLTLSLKPMQDFDRYGSVEVDDVNILSFKEKTFVKEGYINAGVYLASSQILEKVRENIFSFESFLENEKDACYYIEDSYFVDIGIPKDYKKAQVDLKDFFIEEQI